MSFRTILILFNAALIVGFLAFLAFRVLRLKYNKERTPENLTPFFDDEVLEGAHLERVLGVALIALVVVVLGLLAYFIWEPFRQTAAATGFHERSVERGATLFANDQSPAYDSTKSLLCATCHGTDGGGGTAPFTVQSSDPRCDPTAKVTDANAGVLPAEVGRLGRTQPAARAAALLARAAHADHHVRQTGHTDAGVGGAVREGRAPAAEHPGPGELRRQPGHHLRQGESRRRPRRSRAAPTAPRAWVASSCRIRRRKPPPTSGWSTPAPTSPPPRRSSRTQASRTSRPTPSWCSRSRRRCRPRSAGSRPRRSRPTAPSSS